MSTKGKRGLKLSIISGTSLEEEETLLNVTSFNYNKKKKTFNFTHEKPKSTETKKKDNRSVIIDVGGDRFTALKSTLERYPMTRLGKVVKANTVEQILQNCDEFVPGMTPEFFFDRNPDNFPSIPNMYRTDKFHTTGAGFALVLRNDLDYWGH